jgi:DNA-binding transcriptional regulator PaaX
MEQVVQGALGRRESCVTSVVQRIMSAGELQETETKETRSLDKEGRLSTRSIDRQRASAVPTWDAAWSARGWRGRGGGAWAARPATYKASYTKKP